MTKVPPNLSKGDTIAIVCPSGYMPAEKAATCIKVLKEWGYKVRVGKTLGNQFHYFSGTDDERRNDLQLMNLFLLIRQETLLNIIRKGHYCVSVTKSVNSSI